MDIKIKVGVIVTGKDGRILLIKEKLKKKPRALWNIIKGSYDGKETIFEAAIRECKEEASLDTELTHSLGAYISEEGKKIRIQFNFLALADGKPAKIASATEQMSRDEDIEEVAWFTKEEVLKINPDDFVSVRAYELIRNWTTGERYPLETYKQVGM